MRTPLHLNRTLRAAGLLVLGALGVHSLRYGLAYGSQTGGELHRQGHGYLAELIPYLLGVSTALCLGAVVLRLTRTTRVDATRTSRLRTALVYAVALYAIFAIQELSEGALASGHPQGLTGLIAEGGWLALPLSAIIGACLAGLQSWLERAEQRVVDRVAPNRAGRYSASALWVRTRPSLANIATLLLAFGFSRRPPPATSSV